MSHESSTLGFQETQTTNPDSEHLLRNARENYLSRLRDVAFFDLCQERHIDPLDDYDKQDYWEAVADYGHRLSEVAQSSGNNSEEIVLQEIFMAAPSFVYKKSLLDGEGGTPQEEISALDRVSHFSDLIRQVGEKDHGIRASQLTSSLVEIVNHSVEQPELQDLSPRLIRREMRGMQHEIAFGQLLRYTGRTYRSATRSEDIKRGFDYMVTGKHGKSLKIDVKASLTQLESAGQFARLYSIADDGVVKMYSLLRDGDLKDRFNVSEELAVERGKYLDGLLDEISFNASTTFAA